ANGLLPAPGQYRQPFSQAKWQPARHSPLGAPKATRGKGRLFRRPFGTDGIGQPRPLSKPAFRPELLSRLRGRERPVHAVGADEFSPWDQMIPPPAGRTPFLLVVITVLDPDRRQTLVVRLGQRPPWPGGPRMTCVLPTHGAIPVCGGKGAAAVG